MENSEYCSRRVEERTASLIQQLYTGVKNEILWIWKKNSGGEAPWQSWPMILIFRSRRKENRAPLLDIPLPICYPFLQIKKIGIYFQKQ